MKIGDLKPYGNNPRKNDAAVDMVAQSIRDFGFKNPIIVDRENVIIAGHTRLKAAEQIGLDEVPVIVADDLTEEQARAFRLVDNRTAEVAEWDFEKLKQEMGEIDIDLTAYSFTYPEIDETEVVDIIEDEPPEPDEENEPVAKIGDVWKLGRHLLLCGDCTDEKAIAKIAGEGTADLYITDPPYNVNYEGTAGTILNDHMKEAEFNDLLKNAFKTADKIMRTGAAFYIWHGDNQRQAFNTACASARWKIRQCLIWAKNTFVIGRQDYQWKHEPCLYGWKDGQAHYFTDSRTETTILEDRPNINKMSKAELKEYIRDLQEPKTPTTIIRENKPISSKEHPTMKPVKLIAYLVRNSSRRGETVFDGFGGSGTTLIACEQTGRNCLTVELDPKYCDVIVKRWEALTGKKAERINT